MDNKLVIDLAKSLIEINTENPPGREIEAARFIRDYLEEASIESELIEFSSGRANLIASVGEGNGLMINGHLDTVPSDGIKASSVDGDKLYGRGASDMKGGIAAILASIKGLDFKKIKRKLLLTFVADEEVNFEGTKLLLDERKDIFRDINCGVIAEPTSLNIQIAQKGLVGMDIFFSGKAAHGSTPWLGENAIEKASRFITKLNAIDFNKVKENKLLGPNTLNIGKISGGIASNIVPPECKLSIDIRTTSEEVTKEGVEIIKKLLLDVDKNSRIKIKHIRNPVYVNPDLEIVEKLKKISGSKLVGSPFYTEAELYKNNAGIECVVFGPGDISVSHKPNEYVSIKNLKKSEIVFNKLIQEWCF